MLKWTLVEGIKDGYPEGKPRKINDERDETFNEIFQFFINKFIALISRLPEPKV